MSMKEYELLRQKYTKHNESNFYNISNANNNENNYNHDSYISKDNDEPKENHAKRSHTYDLNDNNNKNQEIQSNKSELTYNNIYDRVYDNHIHNVGLRHYDWSTNENSNISPLVNNGNKILNENLFKRNYKRKHSLYGNNYYSDKNLKNKFEINYFNNQILQNKNWGNDNDINKYRSGRRSFTNSIQKSDGINMRTRKKI